MTIRFKSFYQLDQFLDVAALPAGPAEPAPEPSDACTAARDPFPDLQSVLASINVTIPSNILLMAPYIATIIAVSTDAMILFHSKDGIGVPSLPPRAQSDRAGRTLPCPTGLPDHRHRARQRIGFPPRTQMNYDGFGTPTKRACCRSRPAPHAIFR